MSESARTPGEIVGGGDAEHDWRIDPTGHADLFRAEAPELAGLLESDRPSLIADQYERYNDEAVEARDVFKSTVLRANRAIFVTAGVAAALLVIGGLGELLGEASGAVVRGVGFVGTVSGALATMWLSRLQGGKLADRWAATRARAEAKRLAYFRAVIEAAQDTVERHFALEYVRRYLLDNQIDYFRDRGAEHRRAADRALTGATRAATVASTATALASAASIVEPRLAVLAGVGVVASGYAAFASSRTEVDQDRTNADRYAFALLRLEDRRLELSAYRERVAAGEEGAVETFYEPVFLVLRSDHDAFLDEAAKREAAIGEMRERLDAAKEGLKSG